MKLIIAFALLATAQLTFAESRRPVMRSMGALPSPMVLKFNCSNRKTYTVIAVPEISSRIAGGGRASVGAICTEDVLKKQKLMSEKLTACKADRSAEMDKYPIGSEVANCLEEFKKFNVVDEKRPDIIRVPLKTGYDVSNVYDSMKDSKNMADVMVCRKAVAASKCAESPGKFTFSEYRCLIESELLDSHGPMKKREPALQACFDHYLSTRKELAKLNEIKAGGPAPISSETVEELRRKWKDQQDAEDGVAAGVK